MKNGLTNAIYYERFIANRIIHRSIVLFLLESNHPILSNRTRIIAALRLIAQSDFIKKGRSNIHDSFNKIRLTTTNCGHNSRRKSEGAKRAEAHNVSSQNNKMDRCMATGLWRQISLYFYILPRKPLLMKSIKNFFYFIKSHWY